MPHTAMIDLLWEGVRHGRVDASAFSGLSLTDGQTLNVALLARHLATGERLGGWKLGLTSGRSRDAFGSGIRPFGHILESRIFESGTHLSRYPGMRLENELCFTLAAPLAGGNVDAGDARQAVATVAPAFELNQMRVGNEAGPGLRIAENLSQWGIVAGAEVRATEVNLDAIEVALTLDGSEVDRVAAAGHIDNHFESIARLARELALFDRGLEPGQRIITGAFTRAEAAKGCWLGRFGDSIGQVEVTVR